MTTPAKPSTADNVAPTDYAAERACLAAILFGGGVDALRIVEGVVEPRDIHRDIHRWAYEAARAVAGRGDHLDAIGVAHELRRTNRLDDVGGEPWLFGLVNEPVSLTPDAVATYARRVADAAVRRAIITAGGELAALGYDTSITDPLERIEALRDTLARLERRATATRPTVAWVSSTWADYGRVVGNIEWVWEGWLPRRMVSFAVGSGDAGKSQLALSLTKTTLYGGQWPDGTPTLPVGRALWVDTEGSGAITYERMTRWGINPSDVLTVRVGDDLLNDVLVDDPVGLAAIERELQEHHVALVVIDSLRGAHRAKEKDDDAMSVILKSLASLATRYDCAILVIHHVTKKDPREPDVLTPERVRGSSVIVNMGRSVIGVDIPDPETPDPANPRRRVFVLKGNIGRKPAPVGMDIGDAGLTFTLDAPTPPRPDTALNRAVDFLAARLDRGPVPTTDLEREAAAQGLSAASINRARKTLGAVAVKDIHGRWLTSLPYKGASD